ncbi:MAG: C10 family peptidase [Bacteroidales bacterium]|nr:C10 family peptidase [Bacteroidales bacterium]
MKALFSLLFSMLLVASCSTHENLQELRLLDSNTKERVSQIGISQNSTKISPEEAAIVAYMERFGAIQTKSEIRTAVSSTSPILGEDGDTLMYVIQYADQQGYMVVSATKNYHPILVDVEHGEYNPNQISQSGASLYYDAYKNAIASSQEQPEDQLAQIRMQWSPYEEHIEPIRPKTKSSNDDLISLLEASIEEWEAEGYNYYFLWQCPNYLPEDIYNRFVSIAEGMSNENYDIYENCVILERRVDSQTNIGPLLETAWNQHRFIYSGDTVYVGCVSVALGQILAYHRNPISLNWDSILQGEAHRQAFLEDLAYSLESSFGETGTGASLEEVKDYLSYNDYSYTQINHNNNLVIGSLSNQRPVYMEGFRERARSGHAWVCDGYRSSSSNFTYILKILSPAEPLCFETADSYSTSTASSQGLHMNWGWGGTDNGYYHDSDIDYSRDRKELINIHP